jgi:hypothetical protein
MGDIVAAALLRDDELQVEFVSINFQFSICLLPSASGGVETQTIRGITSVRLHTGWKLRPGLSRQAGKPSKTGPKHGVAQRFAPAATGCIPAANCGCNLKKKLTRISDAIESPLRNEVGSSVTRAFIIEKHNDSSAKSSVFSAISVIFNFPDSFI